MAAPLPFAVCQIGARENYAIARALARRGALDVLLTDAWLAPGPPGAARFAGRLGERHHGDLAAACVAAPTLAAVGRTLADRAAGRGGWRAVLARNAWFARWAAARLARLPDRRRAVFAYSYAAGDILAVARARGWPAVLGQIDPGPVEARLVAALHADAGGAAAFEAPPPAYWDAWRRETALCDTVVVNSRWSEAALLAEGVDPAKIVVLPLAYEAAPRPAAAPLPSRFDAARPLRVLFLGQVTPRKGIHLLFDALARLPDAPVRLDVVGPVQMAVPQRVRADRRIVLHGPVPRSAVAARYAAADVFAFPTLSDGFGLTQLEALAAGVPVIASARCGEAVTDGVDGVVVDPVDAPALAAVLAAFLADPARLAALRANAALPPRFALDALGAGLERLGEALAAGAPARRAA